MVGAIITTQDFYRGHFENPNATLSSEWSATQFSDCVTYAFSVLVLESGLRISATVLGFVSSHRPRERFTHRSLSHQTRSCHLARSSRVSPKLQEHSNKIGYIVSSSDFAMPSDLAAVKVNLVLLDAGRLIRYITYVRGTVHEHINSLTESVTGNLSQFGLNSWFLQIEHLDDFRAKQLSWHSPTIKAE